MFHEIKDGHRLSAEIQSGHHYVLRESKSIFLALVVNDVEDVRGGEVIDGTTFSQYVLMSLAICPTKS